MTQEKLSKPCFALMGVAGFIAPRHLEAIQSNNGELLAAMDPNDSVGILDRYFPHAEFFVSFERFERFIYKQRATENPVKFMSICSPNHLHDTHCRFSLNNGANAICEKPLVLMPSNLERLREAEQETGKRIFCILQLRLHSKIIALREMVQQDQNKRYQVSLEYITSRGPWYDISWKGDESKSGGVLFNIGIHFFDMLLHVFGSMAAFRLDRLTKNTASGKLTCAQADITWKLSTNRDDLPKNCDKPTFREIKIDGQALEFSDGFTDLHAQSYEAILNGRGFGLDEVKPSLELVDAIRKSNI